VSGSFFGPAECCAIPFKVYYFVFAIMSDSPTEATLLVGRTKDDVQGSLNKSVVKICAESLKVRGTFTVALSGGSLPSLLSSLDDAFQSAGVDPKYDCWHVILADERCVPFDDPDCNMKSIREHFLSKVPIPEAQIYAIDESKIDQSAEEVARAYEESVVKKVLKVSGTLLDLAILGFGPDGHTCSLFPEHPLLTEMSRSVAPIEDSPKPPPRRITLTFLVLNTQTRHVIFCGTGQSKSPVLQAVFSSVIKSDSREGSYHVIYKYPPPFPCAMARPNTPDQPSTNTLTWVVDADAMDGVHVSEL
jgi:6-phosphogluconolactonase